MAVWAIWFMLLISLISAGDYFIGFWAKIGRRVERRQRRPFILRRRKRDRAVPATPVSPADASQN